MGAFIALRFRRLFIPLLFGMLVIIPPQIYMERLTQGFQGSYWDFYPSIFELKPYPQGNTSWHHLWFILYLMVYDILFAPFFKWIVGARGQRFLARCNWLASGVWIYVLIIPSVIWFTAFNLKYPGTDDLIHDYCRLVYWLLFLLVGFICIAHTPFMDSLERNRRLSFGVAFVSIIGINYLRWNSLEPWDVIANYKNDWRTYAYMAVSAITAWFWVFTAIGYGKRYLNKKHRVLNYVNQAVYPFYILHQTVIVILAYYVVQVSESILAKYLFIVVVTFVVSMAIYHLFIKPFGLMRFLFGMKPAAKKLVSPPEKAIEMLHPPIQIS